MTGAKPFRNISSQCGTFPDRPDVFTSQKGQDKEVLQRYITRCIDGVFVEFGARDGVRESNTNFFERQLHWRGLLFEADPRQVMDLRKNRPDATVIEGAVCPRGMQNVSYLSSRIGGFSGFASSFEPSRRRTVTHKIVRPCYQLADVLRAQGFHRVDYMTIDTEGSEAMLVEDFPWGDFDVRVVQIEQLDESMFPAHRGHQERIEKRLAPFGYKLATKHVVRASHTYDLIYTRTGTGAGSRPMAQGGWKRRMYPEAGVLYPVNITRSSTALRAAARNPRKPGEPRFFVSMATLPDRNPYRALRSILEFQTHAPEVVLVVAPRTFLRFPNKTVDLERIRKPFNDTRLETQLCDTDNGPGTKLLCALPRLREVVAASDPSDAEWALVVVDDDKQYRGWSLRGFSDAMRVLPLPWHAFSYVAFTVPVPALPSTPLRMLQGADMFAMPASQLFAGDGIAHFFECALRQTSAYRWHDDFWISAYLMFVRNVSMVQVPVNYSGFHALDRHNWRKVVTRSSRDGGLHGGKSLGFASITGASNASRKQVEKETSSHLPATLKMCGQPQRTSAAVQESIRIRRKK
jgi:hypothetical protein